MNDAERDAMLCEMRDLLLAIGHEVAASGTWRSESLQALLRRIDPQPIRHQADPADYTTRYFRD